VIAPNGGIGRPIRLPSCHIGSDLCGRDGRQGLALECVVKLAETDLVAARGGFLDAASV